MNNTSPTISIHDLRHLVEAINNTYAVDFGHYAMSSLQRRLMRILTVYKLKSVEELIKRIQGSKSFFEGIVEEITVNTTEMFRDPSMWLELKKELQAFDSTKVIRIWHAGCSSGEEVYSMAILLKELGMLNRVKIFATDINEKIITRAKSGKFLKKNLSVNAVNYSKYNTEGDFTKYYVEGDKWVTMDTSLISSVHFRNHNLTSLESFSKFDIILCRNVMIYFDKVLQDKVFGLFHESLYKYGILVIGARESLVWCSISNKFKMINDREKLYKKVLN